MNKEEQSLLSIFQQAEKASLASVKVRLENTQAGALDSWEDFFQHYRKKIENIVRQLSEARTKFEENAEVFRKKLLDGPVSEDEFRARTILLEMEYESRLKLAEEGYAVLMDASGEYSDRERERIGNLCHDLEGAARLQIEIVRDKILHPFKERDDSLRALSHELHRTKEALRILEEREKTAEDRSSAERIAELERALDQERCVHAERVAQVQSVIDRAWKKAHELEGLRTELEQERRTREEATAEAQRQGVRRNRAEQERDEALAQNTRLERAAFDSREEVLVLRAKVDDAKGKLDVAAVRAEKAVAEREAMRRRLSEIERDLDARDKIFAIHEEEMEALRQQLKESAQKESKALDENAAKKYKEELARSEREAARLKKELISAAAQRETQTEAWVRELDEVRSSLKKAVRDKLSAEAEQQKIQTLADEQKERLKKLQKTYLAADVGRDKMRAERDEKWEAEKEDYEERLSQAARELNTLKTVFKESQRTWEESYARQDGLRMREIFKLKAELDQIKKKGSEG